MTVELAAIFSALVGGVLFLRALGMRGWGLAPLGFLAGLFIEVGIALLQLAVRLPTSPALMLALTVALPAVLYGVRWRRGHDVAIAWRPAAAVAAGVAALVGVFRVIDAFRWHVDSLVYLNASDLLATGEYYDAVNNYLLIKRLIGVPALHAPAGLIDEVYLRSVTPLMALSIIAAFVWFLRRGLTGRIAPAQVTVFTVLGVAFLVTANRFVFHFMYLNGHLFVGGAILVIAAACWVIARGFDDATPALLGLVAVAILAAIVTRPEGGIYAALTLLPALLSPQISLARRKLLAWLLAGALILWFGTSVTLAWQFGFEPGAVSVGMLGVGIGVAFVPWLLRFGFVTERGSLLLRITEAGLWLGLAAFTVRSTTIFVESATATAGNTLAGKWGLTLIMTLMLVLGAVIALRVRDSVYLRFPVTTFLPMAFVLAYVRGGSYRLGHYDSLNRMWMQILPLAVLFIAAALAEGKWRFPVPARWSAEDAPAAAAKATATPRKRARKA